MASTSYAQYIVSLGNRLKVCISYRYIQFKQLPKTKGYWMKYLTRCSGARGLLRVPCSSKVIPFLQTLWLFSSVFSFTSGTKDRTKPITTNSVPNAAAIHGGEAGVCQAT